jgi:hypothetical protein
LRTSSAHSTKIARVDSKTLEHPYSSVIEQNENIPPRHPFTALKTSTKIPAPLTHLVLAGGKFDAYFTKSLNRKSENSQSTSSCLSLVKISDLQRQTHQNIPGIFEAKKKAKESTKTHEPQSNKDALAQVETVTSK